MQTWWLETLEEILNVFPETFLDAKPTAGPSHIVCTAFSLQVLL